MPVKRKADKLTLQQEKFCREYVLCMNASEAYRRAFPGSEKWKPESLWTSASTLLASPKVRQRVNELKNNLEELLGINKATEINELKRIRERCMQPEPVIEWQKVKGKMEKVQKTDDQGRPVFQFDSTGAINATDKIMKSQGYYAPDKVDHTTKGETLKIETLTVEILKRPNETISSNEDSN
jgi:phage terminase small subunit